MGHLRNDGLRCFGNGVALLQGQKLMSLPVEVAFFGVLFIGSMCVGVLVYLVNDYFNDEDRHRP